MYVGGAAVRKEKGRGWEGETVVRVRERWKEIMGKRGREGQ